MVLAFLFLAIYIVWRQTTIPNTFREYAVGDKNFHTSALVISVLATGYGGGMVINSIERIHLYGLTYVYLLLCFSFLSFWIIGWLSVHMIPFIHNLSMSETIGRAYGKYARLIASIANISFCILAIAIQIHVMSFAIHSCIDNVNPNIISLLVIFILVCYVTIGGMRIVTFIDLIKFFAFFLVIPCLILWIPKKTGMLPSDIVYKISMKEKFSFKSMFEAWSYNPIRLISCFLSMLCININPTIIQIVYMAKNRFQAKQVFFLSGIFGFFIMLFIVCIGLMASAAISDKSQIKLWSYIISGMPTILKGLTAISLISICMSTADSYLNNASVMFSNDLVQTFLPKKSINFRHKLLLAKIASIIISIQAILLSFLINDLSELRRLFRACLIPIVTAPFVFAVLGFRTNTQPALIGMFTGLVVVCVWNKWIYARTFIDGSIPGMLANSLAMLLIHFVNLKICKKATKKTS